MKYISYSLTELIRHDEFIEWVLNPTPESNAFWAGYLEHFPEKTKTIESAREYIMLLAEDTGKNRPTEAQSSKMWKVVEEQMYVEEPVAAIHNELTISPWQWLRVAASIFLITGIAVVSFWYFNRPQNVAEVYDQPVLRDSAAFVNLKNDNKTDRMILLPDGSSVVLAPGSGLSYKNSFAGKRREVILTGKAFFEIVKNPSKPFLVYSRGIVTKVLGTSFTIDASISNSEVKVEVKTGKVTVFPIERYDASEKEVAKAEKKGVILYPDQRIVLSPGSGKILKPVEMSMKEPGNEDIAAQLFIFDETPVSEVFKALEDAYQVKINYNARMLKDCPLTATLVGQPFNKKLDVICHAIDATYEINGNQVTVTGEGCK